MNEYENNMSGADLESESPDKVDEMIRAHRRKRKFMINDDISDWIGTVTMDDLSGTIEGEVEVKKKNSDSDRSDDVCDDRNRDRRRKDEGKDISTDKSEKDDIGKNGDEIIEDEFEAGDYGGIDGGL